MSTTTQVDRTSSEQHKPTKHVAHPVYRPRLKSDLGRAIQVVVIVAVVIGFLATVHHLHHVEKGVAIDTILHMFGSIAVFDRKALFPASPQTICPQEDELIPVKNKAIWAAFDGRLRTDEFKNKAIAWLSGAVRIPTESYDDMGPVDVDPRWQKFAPFHEYLQRSFPLIHSNLRTTKVNSYDSIYEWNASDTSLKPILLTAHQDVVPVDSTTVDDWVHPPFSGFCDGERIWGRGSADDKNGLIAIMSVVETLLALQFKPKRKIVLAFGFDEEASGLFGAHELNKHLESTYGRDSFAMIVDEGDGFSEQYGTIFAIPAIGEKGYFDTRVEVTTPGGHSSIPPAHTSIGILASLIVAYESSPIKSAIDRNSPVYGMMQCMAEHALSMDSRLRKAIVDSTTSDKALHVLESLILVYPDLRSSIATTQAIDLVQGGVKANALPERAWAIINHRIATQSSVAIIKERDTKVIVDVVDKFNLTLNAFGEVLFRGSGGAVELSVLWDYSLEPAPVAPTSAAPYKLLSGTIRTTYNSHRSVSNRREIRIAPGIMTGNTDTCSYWNLTQHIFRYNHQDMTLENKVPGGIHTVNESFAVDNLLEMVRFFMTLILNADENEL